MEHLSGHGGWNNKVRAIDMHLLRKEEEKFNNSIAFFSPENQAKLYVEVQKQLGLKAYHYIDLNDEIFLITFETNIRFPYMTLVNDLVHRLHSAGLIEKWFIDGWTKVAAKMLKSYILETVIISAEPDDFNVPYGVRCGWIASVILFIFENIWNRIEIKFGVKIERLITSKWKP